MSNLYGSIDLTILGNIVRQHPSLVREVQFKDGIHKMLNIDVNERKQPSDKGATHYIKASCKKEQQVQGVNYFVADLKPSQYGAASQQQPAVQAAPATAPIENADTSDLPF